MVETPYLIHNLVLVIAAVLGSAVGLVYIGLTALTLLGYANVAMVFGHVPNIGIIEGPFVAAAIFVSLYTYYLLIPRTHEFVYKRLYWLLV